MKKMNINDDKAGASHKVLQQNLSEEHRPDAMLGLGSTYRTLGRYAEAKDILGKGMNEYPNNREFKNSRINEGTTHEQICCIVTRN